MKTHQFNRRAFLRGTGVTMALPWLESFNVWGDEPKKNKPASEAPVRLCVTFSGNGFQSKEWWAKGEGKAMELGRVLARELPEWFRLHASTMDAALAQVIKAVGYQPERKEAAPAA